MKANVYDNGQIPNMDQKAKTKARKTRVAWYVPIGLILLSIIPLTGGAFRLIELAKGAEITAANARFFASPLPVIFHIVGACLYAFLGAFQFVSHFWRKGTSWHRIVGRLLVPCGLAVGLSGIWMTLFYSLPPHDGALLYVLRLIFGSGMVISIILGYFAIRRRDIIQHRAWMTRAYAIGLGAGTQVLTLMIGELIAGKPSVFSRALLMGAAWVINLAIAEWSIRRRPVPSARREEAIVSNPQ
ncbi:MAG: DUF2306 domain-containing protein [Anaerolineales bacterium]